LLALLLFRVFVNSGKPVADGAFVFSALETAQENYASRKVSRDGTMF
jgi:hypothetical protein